MLYPSAYLEFKASLNAAKVEEIPLLANDYILLINSDIQESTFNSFTADESLEVWKTNTVSIRLILCEMMMEKFVKIKPLNSTPQDLYMCISEVAKDPRLLYMKISETAAACAVLLD